MIVLSKCWAKTVPFQSIVTHGLISGYVAQNLLDKYLSPGEREVLQRHLEVTEKQLKSFVGYLASVHDIGKIEFNFQSKDPKMREWLEKEIPHSNALPVTNIRHEKTGQRSLFELWSDEEEDEDSIDLFSEVIGAHHQGKHGKSGFSRKNEWFSLQSAFEKQMRHVFREDGENGIPTYHEDAQGVVGVLLLGLVILSDWISSGPAFEDAESWAENEDAADKVADRVDDFLRKSGMMPAAVSWPDDFSEIWKFIPPQGQRLLQKKTQTLLQTHSDRYVVILLEAPTGEGKTEAGVYAAIQMAKQWGKDGFYIALPTAATANQMVDRMRSLLEMHDLEQSVRLLHAMAWMEQSESCQRDAPDEADAIASWLAPVKRGLLGQYAVGTIDQAMLAATTVKYGVLRLLGLTNKVLVIDEIHSYDAYMSSIITRLLEWCKALEIPVVMLSATLPPAKKKELFRPYAEKDFSDAYPLITAITEAGEVIEETIEQTTHRFALQAELLPCLDDPAKIAEAAINTAKDGGCICVLMNTVKQAQAVYMEIRSKWKDDLLLFHAQFPAGRRAELEEACVQRYGKDKSRRPARSILVATQVVEQSLDVDFDAMITAIAPIDLLIQRMGRVHRHSDTQRPKSLSEASVRILIPSEENRFGSSRFVYPECLLKSAVRIMEEKRNVRIPEDVAQMVCDGYNPAKVPPNELAQWLVNQIKDQVQAGASQTYLINPPDRVYNALSDTLLYEDDDRTLSAATRLSEPTARVALLPEDAYQCLKPYLRVDNGITRAEIWRKDLAEMVMKQTISVRISRFGNGLSPLWYTHGDKLLSGIWILPMKDGCCQLENGKRIVVDQELGLLIN